MLPSEAIRVALFISTVLAIYLAAAGFLLRHLIKRLLGRAGSKSLLAAMSRFERVVLALAAAGLVCIAYGYFVEPYWLEITRVRLASPKIPAGHRPIRVVLISDVHSDPRPLLEERLPAVIAGEKPDMILFAGDAINSPAAAPVFRGLMTQLARVAPTYAVRGNWDVTAWGRVNLYGETGVRVLDGESLFLEFDGPRVWLAGATALHAAQVRQVLAEAPRDVFTVFLYHLPDEIEEAAQRGIDLYAAGHTHGGQVALPWYGALVTLSKYGKKYEAGLYRERETWMYVNRGVGLEGWIAPRVRFFARPEVTVIEIAPSQ